ncbi:hypothetical protein PRIPAC_85205 [Pristionchus pacificus]|uniref:Uncharacterized protein n=1 Tax=Pristionchus pacificus TaxID=54126 RepID=A0A454Y470_PRIPA|nr:hypothetical protein PRIPAC_85205 [Pristionchus pacificus]|eukprot:PDM68718.1 hypothetical protein PRIPAC_47020 [Pristionchus pacificus]
MALLADVQHCFKELENPENVEETLLELSQMNITSAVLNATNACWLIMSHFTHPTGGDLARRLAMDWMKIRSPKIPTLFYKKEADTQDAVPSKRRRISEQEESFESVNSIEEEVEEFNPFLSDSSHGKSSFFCCDSNKENIPESSEQNVAKTNASKEIAVKKSTSPPLASFSSSNSIKKSTEESRLEEISLRIAKAKAEKEAKHRKAVIIAEHDYINSRRRIHLSK